MSINGGLGYTLYLDLDSKAILDITRNCGNNHSILTEIPYKSMLVLKNYIRHLDEKFLNVATF